MAVLHLLEAFAPDPLIIRQIGKSEAAFAGNAVAGCAVIEVQPSADLTCGRIFLQLRSGQLEQTVVQRLEAGLVRRHGLIVLSG